MATVLAAVRIQRLGGRTKSALRIEGVSVLERLVEALRDGGAESVHVVVGPYLDVFRPLIERCAALELLDTRLEPSLADSQRLAVAAHAAQWPRHDLLLTVADLPLLAANDVARLVEAWHARAPGVQALQPVVDGVRGHPVVLSADAARQVAGQPLGLGVRDWTQQHPELVARWATSSAVYITDVDTPSDLQALRRRLHPAQVAWPEGTSHYGTPSHHVAPIF